MKIKVLIILITLIILILLPDKIRKMDIAFSELNMCFDISVCKEGITVGVGNESIKINKENCEKYNWTWDDEKKYCDMRSKD
ncbi:MAG: hypothetical protein LBK53_02510 [Heliobacteriaceae bacterium]|jgi:hypothetical protein|nr:hypothetical protein [Heliobacteriaceae bacterium]